MGGNSKASCCVALNSLQGALSQFILCDTRTLALASSRLQENRCSSLGPQKTVSHFRVFTCVTQSIWSFSPCSPGEPLFILKNPFQIGHMVSLSPGRWAGGVVLKKCIAFARCVEVSQLVAGIEWGLWPTVLWFGVNVIHHQRKDSLSTSPLAIRTRCKLGQIYSLCYMEGEGSYQP